MLGGDELPDLSIAPSGIAGHCVTYDSDQGSSFVIVVTAAMMMPV